MNPYDLTEKKGRDKFKILLDENWKIDTYEFTPTTGIVDGFFTGKTSTAAFEIKDRSNHSYEEYSDEGYILEEMKLNNLNRYKDDYDYLLYVNFFKDKVLIWDVKNDTTPVTYGNFSKTTAENYRKGNTKKKVRYLKITDTMLTYNVNN